MKSVNSRRLLLSVLAGVSLASVAALPNAGPERAPHKRVVSAVAETEARVIVKLKSDSVLAQALSATSGATARPANAQSLSARLGLSLTDGRALGPRTQVLKGAGLSSQQLAQRLSAEPDVEFAEVDGRMQALAVPNDPLYPAGQTAAGVPPAGQWYLRAPTSATIVDTTSVVSSINAEAAWTVTSGSPSVVVAVLDTGVRRDHPDLTSKLLPGYDFISDTTVSNDGDGRDADPSDPGDYGCGETTSSWHGTQTSGLIGAATNNSIGMASVGHDVMVLPLRVLGCGGGYDSDIQAAMLYAAGITVGSLVNPTPAKVLNMSLGATGACSASYAQTIAQVNAKGAVVVVAAGNDGLDVGSPANCAGAIAVAGVRHAGTKVGYSDLGTAIAVAAPAGNCVNSTGPCLYPLLTTSNSGTTTPIADAAGGSIYTGTGANASLGTSFSAPMVAGSAALMFSANPSLTPAQVLAGIKASARPFPSSGAPAIVSTTSGALQPVAACTAPSATAQSDECYCTTSTCGAGLLDTGAATALAAGVHASISPATASETTGAVAVLDGSGSWPAGAASATSALTYQWSIVSGGTLATLSSSTSSTASLQIGSVAGTVVVGLTVTDSAGNKTSSQQTITVTKASTSSGSSSGGSSSGSSSGGGGGAMSPGWLLAWLAAVIAVWVVTPRQRRRKA